ncbi:hypothetical protein CA54_01570 [Symmachiella macrocystis]|uniref:Putative restriction endonuclease domain-containing protein n=1 Tax=Symmachiella macrocystis TaxID=2527985 RepID=A0A5C6BHB8_9PLAN|nr:Uma2 family endonuclease [Symmachiella macrocystis]TWU11350.1 hypothetical protein CA54_01570 [Symmachiella macrocystis]
MATTTPVTADELIRICDDSTRYELVSGELHMMSPAGWRHGELVFRLSMLIGAYVEQNRLGRCFGAETGFLIQQNPDTVLAPGIAFIAVKNLPDTEPEQAYWPSAPDLVVEVRSPQDRDAAVQEKAIRWLAAGGELIWDIDPAQQCVTVYRPQAAPLVIPHEESLDGGTVLPGFCLPLAGFFE